MTITLADGHSGKLREPFQLRCELPSCGGTRHLETAGFLLLLRIAIKPSADYFRGSPHDSADLNFIRSRQLQQKCFWNDPGIQQCQPRSLVSSITDHNGHPSVLRQCDRPNLIARDPFELSPFKHGHTAPTAFDQKEAALDYLHIKLPSDAEMLSRLKFPNPTSRPHCYLSCFVHTDRKACLLAFGDGT